MRSGVRSAAVGLILLLQALWVPPVLASTLDISLNSDAVRLSLEWPMPNNKVQIDGGWLHDQDTGDVVYAGGQLVDSASGESDYLKAGVGGKLFFIEPDLVPADGIGLGLGGFVDYTFPNYDRFSVRGYLYYAPDVLSTSDLDDFYDVGAYVGYDILRDALIYLGIRETKADFRNTSDVKFDSGLNIGFRWSF